ncbi:hypothetical protein AB7W11_17285 [Providencia manganoxydans]|uniref:hypothetical protein n=1 Tax=Providencia manganoxydans TaxID=2923283 RepID=UPI0034E3A135
MASNTYHIELKPIQFLCSSEETDERHIDYLSHKIACDGTWTTPIPCEIHTGIIMDGNHRYQVAKQLKLSLLPCILLSYQDNRVKVNYQNSDKPYDIQNIFEAILYQNKLLPYKTTKHHFSPFLPTINVNLDLLKRL